jgi:transposase-like protein
MEYVPTVHISQTGQDSYHQLYGTAMPTPFPLDHWRRIRTSNVLERVSQEIRQRSRVIRLSPMRLLVWD